MDQLFQVGQVVNQWKVTCKLGEGAFGAVFKVNKVSDPTKWAAIKTESLIAGAVSFS